MNKLDEWDNKLIKLFKGRGVVTPKKACVIWAERCALSREYSGLLRAVNTRLLAIVYEFRLLEKGLRFGEFIYSLAPDKNWQFVCQTRPYLTKETTDYDVILFSRLDSLFTNTEVKYLPGFIVCDGNGQRIGVVE